MLRHRTRPKWPQHCALDKTRENLGDGVIAVTRRPHRNLNGPTGINLLTLIQFEMIGGGGLGWHSFLIGLL
jgi:hypothetical protein